MAIKEVVARGAAETRYRPCPVPLVREGRMGGEKAFAFAECLGLATKPLRWYRNAMRMPMIFDLLRISGGFRRK